MTKFSRQTWAFGLIVGASTALYFSASAGIGALSVVLLGLVGIGMLVAIWTR